MISKRSQRELFSITPHVSVGRKQSVQTMACQWHALSRIVTL